MVGGCRGRLVKRRALDKKSPTVAAVAAVPKATGAVELLELPASSNLDIASKGPRAAGNLLVTMFANGTERLPVCMRYLLYIVYVLVSICLQGRVAA